KRTAGIWANAHGEVGRVLRHCLDELQVYGSSCGEGFGQFSFLALLLLNIYFDFELWQLGNFSPSCNFEKFTQLVPGLLSLTFDGFGFDLWAELVPELWNLDKLSFIVRLFGENCFLIWLFFVASDLV
nr:hypothetical protein [Tanacetum cinerariifolium]